MQVVQLYGYYTRHAEIYIPFFGSQLSKFVDVNGIQFKIWLHSNFNLHAVVPEESMVHLGS